MDGETNAARIGAIAIATATALATCVPGRAAGQMIVMSVPACDRTAPGSRSSARTHLLANFGGIVGGISEAGPAVGVAGLDAELRHYRPTTWVLGARVVAGSGFRADPSDVPPPIDADSSSDTITGPGVWLAPLIGFHWTDQTCGYTDDASVEEYASHVLAAEPVLWAVDGVGGGGHLVWEYDVYGVGIPLIDRLRSAFKAGFVSRLGAGGMWLGTLGMGFVNLELGLGAYVDGDGASLLVSGGIGLFLL